MTTVETIAGDDRPPVYYDTLDGLRVLVIRASAIGTSCLWELAAAGQGVEPGPLPASLVRAFREGNELEPLVVKMLTDDYGISFLSRQDEGELWVADDVVVRYHPDGIAQLVDMKKWWFLVNQISDTDLPLPREVVVEIKCLSHELWKRAVAHGVGSVIDEYPWQLSVMMHDQQKPGLWAVYNKGNPPDEDGNREPCEDEGKIHLEYVNRAPVSLDEITLKAAKIKLGVEGEDILTSDRPCDDPTHWPCRFQYLRPEPESKQPDETVLSVLDDRQASVNQLVRDYVYHKGQADEAIARRDEAKEQIVELAGGTEGAVKRIVTDRWRVPVVRSTQSYVDVDAMTDEERALYESLRRKYRRTKPKAPYLMKIQRIDI